MSSSMTMPTARFVGDHTDLSLRRRYRRLPSDVQRALGTSVICHKRIGHVENALVQFGPEATLSWLGNGLPLRAVDGRRS